VLLHAYHVELSNPAFREHLLSSLLVLSPMHRDRSQVLQDLSHDGPNASMAAGALGAVGAAPAAPAGPVGMKDAAPIAGGIPPPPVRSLCTLRARRQSTIIMHIIELTRFVLWHYLRRVWPVQQGSPHHPAALARQAFHHHLEPEVPESHRHQAWAVSSIERAWSPSCPLSRRRTALHFLVILRRPARLTDCDL